jgi:Zn-dependent peptidase ImmA (M78 family)/transcriptional regulator with XRE-family HTH domain
MSEAGIEWSSPRILRWARERVRVTPEQVELEAQNLKSRFFAPVTTQQVKRWEQGKEEPDLEHLETLAEIYSCPVGYFFMSEIPIESLPFSYRGLSRKESSLSESTIRGLLRFHELAKWTVYLIESLKLEWKVMIPRNQRPDSPGLQEMTARERKRMGWSEEVRYKFLEDPGGLYRWWRKAIEGFGVFCFEQRLDPGEVRGASFWLEGYPFILVNRQNVEADTGRLFTLLHEYVHLITGAKGEVCDFRGSGKGKNLEPFANRFAALMLVSPSELKKRLQSLDWFQPREVWSDAAVDKIREPFGASRDVILIMLQQMQLAPSDLYGRKLRQWEKRKAWGRGRGGRPPLKVQKLRELGFGLSRLLSKASEQSSFLWSDVSDVLEMRVQKAEEFLKWVREEE